MWRSERTIYLVESLLQCEYVGEVILIDNAPGNPHADLLIQQSKGKVTYLTNGKNNYVNPSWNMGVRLAKYDNIALCNDDITFDPRHVFINGSELRDCIFGIHPESYEMRPIKDDAIATGRIEVKTRPHGFGCLMTLNKRDYVPIPEELRVSFGDDWLFKSIPNRIAMLFPIQTEMSTTSRDAEFIAIAQEDSNIWHTLNK